MTVKKQWESLQLWSAFIQVLMVVLINIPTISFGLALGWVSLASGEAAGEGEDAGKGAVVAAVTTFSATLVGVPLSARALLAGRKVALIGTSSCFVVGMIFSILNQRYVICWSLKLMSLWCGSEWAGVGAALLVCARIAAGLGGAAAWALSPLLAREMCSSQYGGAAVSALSLAHNVGVLAMYLAADAAVPHRTVLWWCLGLALAHCIVFSFVPESPSFLAAKGKIKEAKRSLARLRGVSPAHPKLRDAVAALPPPETPRAAARLAREMLSDRQRRRAFIIGAIAVIGQEACGVLAILQYAERVFALARDENKLFDGTYDEQSFEPRILIEQTMNNVTTEKAIQNFSSVWTSITATHMTSLNASISDVSFEAATIPAHLVSPSRQAVILGAIQLATSALSLYLVERVGRRPLLIICAAVTGGALTLAALAAGARLSVPGLNAAESVSMAIALAVAADSAGLQHVPYAVIAEMFHYQYRGCALMLVSAGACAGNALEVALFPAAVAAGGLGAALALGAALTLAYTVFVILTVPETKGRSPEQIYDIIYPFRKITDGTGKVISDTDCGTNKESMCTKV